MTSLVIDSSGFKDYLHDFLYDKLNPRRSFLLKLLLLLKLNICISNTCKYIVHRPSFQDLRIIDFYVQYKFIFMPCKARLFQNIAFREEESSLVDSIGSNSRPVILKTQTSQTTTQIFVGSLRRITLYKRYCDFISLRYLIHSTVTICISINLIYIYTDHHLHNFFHFEEK